MKSLTLRVYVPILCVVALACWAAYASFESHKAANGEAAPAEQAVRIRTAPWPAEVLDAVAHVVVQSHGRVKPMFSEGRLHIKTINGKESVKTAWKEKLTPMAWLLDCLFFPEQARDYRSIAVDDDRVLNSVGLEIGGRSRKDWYSFNELEPAYGRLMELGRELRGKETKQRTSLESQTINLSHTVLVFRLLLQHFDFARASYDVARSPALQKVFAGRETVPLVEVVSRYREVKSAGDDPNLRGWLEWHADLARMLHFLPPVDPGDEVYRAPGDVLAQEMDQGGAAAVDMQVLRRLQQLCAERHDMEKLSAGILALCKDLGERSGKRGETSKIALETAFYQGDYFYKALHWFLSAFLLSLVFWFIPGGHVSPKRGIRMLHRFTFWPALGFLLTAEGLLITGIVMRCLIRGRPPVTTPYEVVLFAAAVMVLLILVVELVFRNGFALSGTAAFGCLFMLLAMWHEVEESTDSMAPLVAVLDTNFWLSTHVTMIVLGYGAGWLAAFLGNLYLLFKLPSVLGVGGADLRKFCSVLSRVIYGVMCFGLLFAIVGTILGGVWANESWGRFWGWDPKENGALMLVLVYLAIAHARLGGYIRELGIAVSAIIVGITVMWAFWGVNLLQIGLHSYGFDETKAWAWGVYRQAQWGAVLFGVAIWGLDRLLKSRAAAVRKELAGSDGDTEVATT